VGADREVLFWMQCQVATCRSLSVTRLNGVAAKGEDMIVTHLGTSFQSFLLILEACKFLPAESFQGLN
jgi:hypothetical protein